MPPAEAAPGVPVEVRVEAVPAAENRMSPRENQRQLDCLIRSLHPSRWTKRLGARVPSIYGQQALLGAFVV